MRYAADTRNAVNFPQRSCIERSDYSQIREHRSCTLVTALPYWLETRYCLVDHEGSRAKLMIARASELLATM
jgi:hypothetical protein